MWEGWGGHEEVQPWILDPLIWGNACTIFSQTLKDPTIDSLMSHLLAPTNAGGSYTPARWKTWKNLHQLHHTSLHPEKGGCNVDKMKVPTHSLFWWTCMGLRNSHKDMEKDHKQWVFGIFQRTARGQTCVRRTGGATVEGLSQNIFTKQEITGSWASSTCKSPLLKKLSLKDLVPIVNI